MRDAELQNSETVEAINLLVELLQSLTIRLAPEIRSTEPIDCRRLVNRNLAMTTIAPSDTIIRRIAECEYANRRLREKWFEADLFGEPCWDILVDLFISGLKGRKVSITSVATASCVPATTALRYIEHLCQQGLIQRHECSSDKRVSFLSLTPSTREALSNYFTEREQRQQGLMHETRANLPRIVEQDL